MNHEQIFIGSCLLEPTLIDWAVQEGLKADAFEAADRRRLWLCLLDNRTNGKLTDLQSIYLELGNDCPADELFACEKAAPTQINGKKALSALLDAHSLSQLRPALNSVLSQIDDGQPIEAVKASVDALESLLRPNRVEEHTLPETVDNALEWAANQISGNIGEEKVVLTGFKDFDDKATPIQMHEYVVLGARTSTGKSSLSNQIASYNLNRGLRVVIFTLETSARAVVLQIAAQRADANLRLLRNEMPDRQERLKRELEKIRNQPLLVFEKDLSLEQIEARCRLLAVSFKPHLVILDYLGLVRVKADGGYERMSKISKAMIPLKKTIGCTLLADAQLNRGNEKDDRPPTRTDLRDSGSVEEDAHRILLLHRPQKDDAGMVQGYDRAIYDCELYQVKNRDGPLAQTRLDFFSGHTKFVEKKS